jgi:hypothetical protein
MEETLNGAAGASFSDQSAVQNSKSAATTIKLVLVWLAVGIPMLWGMMKALEDVPALISLFP